MDKSKRIASTIAFCMLALLVNAQDNSEQDVMRSNGKIYVVVAVVVTIVVGLFIYLWNLDRKIGRMEKKKQ